MNSYDDLKKRCLELIAEGRLPSVPTREQKIDLVYGNCKLSNPDVTREMVERAVDEASATYGCCPKYYECFNCDTMYCEHGVLTDEACKGHTVAVIPFVGLCKECDGESLWEHTCTTCGEGWVSGRDTPPSLCRGDECSGTRTEFTTRKVE